MATHVDADLSAYLDGELPPAERARVTAHLGGCARCRAHLAELRSTASLIGALPGVRPSRSLVPQARGRYDWLRPLRSLSTVASGAFLFMFLVTAVARSGSGLGGGAAAPAALPAASAAAEASAAAGPTALPAPALGAASTPAADAQKVVGPTATPAAQERAGTTAPQAFATNAQRDVARAPAPLTEPALWLGLAVIAAVIAVAAHRRLRTR